MLLQSVSLCERRKFVLYFCGAHRYRSGAMVRVAIVALIVLEDGTYLVQMLCCCNSTAQHHGRDAPFHLCSDE